MKALLAILLLAAGALAADLKPASISAPAPAPQAWRAVLAKVKAADAARNAAEDAD